MDLLSKFDRQCYCKLLKIYNLAKKSKILDLEFKSCIAVALMKIHKTSNEDNIQGYDKIELKNQVKFPSKKPYEQITKSTLLIEIRFDNMSHMIIEKKNKARKYRPYKKQHYNTIYMCAMC